jgi:hypothetical protein
LFHRQTLCESTDSVHEADRRLNATIQKALSADAL